MFRLKPLIPHAGWKSGGLKVILHYAFLIYLGWEISTILVYVSNVWELVSISIGFN